MAIAVSAARAFFEEIKAKPDPAAFISAFCDPAKPMFEGDWLDFKRDPGAGNDKARKGIWSEALGGFANSGDGLLIWGIDVAKDAATGIDCAKSIHPVVAPRALKSRLTELQRSATDPVVPNAEIESYQLRSGIDEGFVVCLVRESPFRPHRSEYGESKQYFIRAGDSFYVASVSRLRTLFYSRLRAIARIEVTTSWESHKSSYDQVLIKSYAQISNVGTATARDSFLIVNTNASKNRSSDFALGTFWTESFRNEVEAHLLTRRPIHPSQTLGLFGLEWFCPARPGSGPVLPHWPDLTFGFRFYADDQEEQRSKVVFDLSKLECMVPQVLVAEFEQETVA